MTTISKPASSRLSAEIWCTILRYTISVPDFLDPDTFEGDLQAPGFGFDYPDRRVKEAVYWDAEKTRNILQRVCKPWNEYLRGFEHRFVDMSDIMHGRVGEISLKKAIRILITRQKCSCIEVCLPPSAARGIFDAFRRFGQFCCDTILSFSRLPALILDLSGGPVVNIWNSGALRSLQQVQVIIDWMFAGDGIDYPLFHQTPNLKHIHGQIYDDLAYLRFTSRTVVTVAFSLGIESSCERIILDLPSLRHLRMDYTDIIASSTFFEKLLMPLLQKVGNQLRSLYIGSWDYNYKIPLELWNLCPRLEKFHPGMGIVPPSWSHPIQTLSVWPEHIFSTLSIQWLNLQNLIFDAKWNKWRYEDLNDLLTLWTCKLKEGGVTLRDVDGMSLEEYMKGGKVTIRDVDSILLEEYMKELGLDSVTLQ